MATRRQVTDINMYRNQRRKSKNVRWVLIPVFLVACLFAGYFFAISGFFAVDNIVIVGNSTVADEDIINIAQIEKGMNIFAVNDNALEQSIPILPRIQSATLERKLPGTIKITVVEREPVALINVGKATAEIDGEGRILDRQLKLSNLELPIVTGVDITDQGVIPGCFLTGEQIETALAILTAIPEDAEDIGEINVTDTQYIKIYTVAGTEVRIGDSENFDEKYLLYSTILLENERKAEKAIKYIDVSIVSKPAFAYE